MDYKVLIFSGNFQYGVVDDFIEGIVDGIGEKYQIVQVNLSDKSNLASILTASLFDNVKFIVSVNALGSDLIPHFPVMNKIPFFSLLLDHPLHSMTRFYGTNMRLLCVDKDHVNFARLVGMNAEFFPHAARVKSNSYLDKSFESKDGILFPASFFNVDAIKEKIIKFFPQGFELLNDGIVENINDFLLKLGFMDNRRTPMIQLNKNSIGVLIQCDLYLRARRRLQIIQDFAQCGVSLNIIGSGWSASTKLDTHRYYEPEPFNELIQRMVRSRFVLHHSPGFNLGLHERITYPLLHRTMVLAAGNDYLKEQFKPGSGILFYDEIDKVESLIKSVDDERYSENVTRGSEIVARNYMWSKSVSKHIQ
ncbi:glycosyltransferase family protein [Rheinheimera nanhaiensis]|uniref:Spore protein YkvP/CgeB glycosyl transferase-like domain-containing protein n=1 Tax=Rheinheimera nanhaiensis E407-8 TaxID=562729 RepID=I1DY15_9GAMM|nr:hypothetical protein [Rheinheimera nanhaiensis]GAB58943.1 hypothetical protein RNAN_1931 [Rheinheimera nanhaiensis E407-8]